MTPSKAILFGSSFIALSIVAAALVLPDGGLLAVNQTQQGVEAREGAAVTAPRYQIVKTEHGRTWRLDTRTGEVTVCRLREDRLVCASSTTATRVPSVTPDQLEAEREARREARRTESNEIFERFMSFFDRIIKFAQKHAGGGKPPPPDDDQFKQL